MAHRRVGTPPRDATFGVEGFEVADDQTAEVDARRQPRPADVAGVERRAQLFDEGVKVMDGEHLVERLVVGMRLERGQIDSTDKERRLPGIAFAKCDERVLRDERHSSAKSFMPQAT